MSELTFVDLLEPGARGDTPLTLNLTARQVAAIQLVASMAVTRGVGHLAMLATAHHGLSDSFSLAYREGELRMGLVLAQAFTPEQKTSLSVLLANLEQEKAALENGEEG